MRNNRTEYECILCGRPAGLFFELFPAPVNVSQLFHDRDDALRAPMGKLALAFCPGCGGISNTAWDPALLTYDASYENSLDASAVFTAYADALARRLVEKYPRDRDGAIVEIGCGQARFLRRLCTIAQSRGIGFDPSYAGEDGDDSLVIHKRLFQPPDAAGARMIVCRHVLEHLEDPGGFVRGLAQAAGGSRAIVYFEVPNAASIFQGGVPWDLIYPHLSYFTIESLSRLFAEAGFHILNAGATYAGQFLFVEAVAEAGANARPRQSGGSPETAGRIAGFADLLSSIVRRWSDYLTRASASRTRIALWGAGAKGVTFLNAVPGARDIPCVVDLNPRKQGSFVPGTGQAVTAPESLREFKPHVVITPNPIYAAEIRGRLAALGISAPLIAEPDGAALA